MISKLKKSGFSLAEMLVSVLIFGILVGAITGVFTSAIKIQRYALSAQDLLSQTSYIMEHASRSLRVAKKDYAGDCIDANKNYGIAEAPFPQIKFKELSSPCEFPPVGCTAYCEEFVLRDPMVSILETQKYEYEVGGGSFYSPLTSPKLKVNYFNRRVTGDDLNSQPRATFFIDVEAGQTSPKPRIRLQTTVSQRDINI